MEGARVGSEGCGRLTVRSVQRLLLPEHAVRCPASSRQQTSAHGEDSLSELRLSGSLSSILGTGSEKAFGSKITARYAVVQPSQALGVGGKQSAFTTPPRVAHVLQAAPAVCRRRLGSVPQTWASLGAGGLCAHSGVSLNLSFFIFKLSIMTVSVSGLRYPRGSPVSPLHA